MIPFSIIQKIWREWVNSPNRDIVYFEKYLEFYGIQTINYGNGHIISNEEKYLLAVLKYEE